MPTITEDFKHTGQAVRDTAAGLLREAAALSHTALESETADRIGPGDCASIVRIPASVHLATRDERLDLAVDALIDLAEAQQVVTIQGGAAATSLNGRDELENAVEVWLWMEHAGGERSAMLSFDGAPAAAF